MIIHTRNDDYEIWANTADRKFYYQMTSEAISEEGYDIATNAILKAEELLSEPQMEVVSCSNPRADVFICKSCIRNRPSDDAQAFKLTKKIGQINHTCDGYIRKDNKALF